MARREVQGVEIGPAAGGMHHQVGRDGEVRRARTGGVDDQAVLDPLDSGDRGAGLDGDTEFLEARHEPADQVGIELRQEPRRALQNGDLRAGARRQVRELGRDITAADQHDPAWQSRQLQEVVAGADQLFPWDAQRDRTGAGGDQHVSGLQGAAVHLDRVRGGEAGEPVEGVDPQLGVAMFLFGGDRIGEGPLERHQSRPIDRQGAFDAMPSHAPGRVDGFFAAHQHLLGVAAAQRAGAAEWPVIHHGDGPAGGADLRHGDLGRRAAADDDQVVGIHEGHSIRIGAKIATPTSSASARLRRAPSWRAAGLFARQVSR